MRQAAVFVALDHCSAECVGIHAAARATRFETLEPIRQGVRQHFGGFTKAIARGLAVRHDHGLQDMSDHCQKELAFLGVDEINKIEIQYDVIDEAHHAGKLTKQKWKHLPWKMTESE